MQPQLIIVIIIILLVEIAKIHYYNNFFRLFEWKRHLREHNNLILNFILFNKIIYCYLMATKYRLTENILHFDFCI